MSHGTKHLKSETAYARQLFLFGEGKTKPIKNVKRLAQLSGAAESTLYDWLPQWRQEAENLAIQSENSPYTLALSEDVLSQHRAEIAFLGEEVRKIRNHLKTLDIGTQNHTVLLSAYNTALTKWEKSSGLLAHLDTVAASMKETARAKARAEAKKTKTELPAPRQVNPSRFNIE